MPREEFIDIINLEADSKNIDEDEGTLATVIKGDELTLKEERQSVGEKKIIESESFTLKLFEKDGSVDSIEIECRCGRSARIQLEYKQAAEDNEDDLLGSLDENHAEVLHRSGEPVPAQVENTEEAPEPGDAGPVTDTNSDTPVDESAETNDVIEEEENEEFQDGLNAPVISAKPEEDVSLDNDEGKKFPEKQDSQ